MGAHLEHAMSLRVKSSSIYLFMPNKISYLTYKQDKTNIGRIRFFFYFFIRCSEKKKNIRNALNLLCPSTYLYGHNSDFCYTVVCNILGRKKKPITTAWDFISAVLLNIILSRDILGLQPVAGEIRTVRAD